MIWALVAGVAAILVLIFILNPARNAIRLTLAAAYARRRGDAALEENLYRQAVDVAAKLKEPLRSKIEGHVEIQWGGLNYRKGQLREAEDLIRRGLVKASISTQREYAVVQEGYIQWGDLCVDQGRYYDAEEHYRQALENDEKTGNVAGIRFELQKIGDVLIRQGRKEDADELVQRAAALDATPR